MKIETLATFRFAYKGNLSKEEAYLNLKKVLQVNDWFKGSLLRSYHSEKDGSCEVILNKFGTPYESKELAKELFSDLINDPDIQWISVLNYEVVSELIYNNLPEYPASQFLGLQDIRKGQEVMIFYRKE